MWPLSSGAPSRASGKSSSGLAKQQRNGRDHSRICWAEHQSVNLESHEQSASIEQRCSERFTSLVVAQKACEAAHAWCGGVTRDSGILCGRGSAKTKHDYELRLADKLEAPDGASITSWLLHRNPSRNSSRCEGGALVGVRRVARSGGAATLRSGGGGGGIRGGGDRLGMMLVEKYRVSQERMARGPPAFERFPEQAFRYRDWGAQTRHGRGDMYPLYTLDTLRNMADHLFDSSTGYQTGPERAYKVQPCQLLYSTLRPTSSFIHKVHDHIKVPYLLMTDTADDAITPYHGVKQLLTSSTLRHWWAVDNEVSEPRNTRTPLLSVLHIRIAHRGVPRLVTASHLSACLPSLRAALRRCSTLRSSTACPWASWMRSSWATLTSRRQSPSTPT